MYCTFCTLYSVVFVRLEPFGSTAYKPFNNNMAANHTIIKTPSKAHAHCAQRENSYGSYNNV